MSNWKIKISLLDECDKIFYLENGKIKDVGDMNILLKKYPEIKGVIRQWKKYWLPELPDL